MDPDGVQLVGVGAALVIILKLLDLLVRWLISKISTSDVNMQHRIDRLEARVETLEHQLSMERTLKHAALQDASAYLGTIHVVDTLIDGLQESCEVEGIECPPAVLLFIASSRRVIEPAIARGHQRQRESELTRTLASQGALP